MVPRPGATVAQYFPVIAGSVGKRICQEDLKHEPCAVHSSAHDWRRLTMTMQQARRKVSKEFKLAHMHMQLFLLMFDPRDGPNGAVDKVEQVWVKVATSRYRLDAISSRYMSCVARCCHDSDSVERKYIREGRGGSSTSGCGPLTAMRHKRKVLRALRGSSDIDKKQQNLLVCPQ